MSRFRWTLLVTAICLPVAVLATGVPLPFIDGPISAAQPLPVSSDEIEIAWLNTTTSWTTWERFVSGVARAQLAVSGLRVDDRRAYRDQTYEVPELLLSVEGRPGRVRIRWYKLSSEATAAQWVEALAARDPAPVAVIGGGTSDRAVELAQALNRQPSWRGDRPLFLITTATADELFDVGTNSAQAALHPALLGIYPERSFRFCFSNRQMAEAVLDFVSSRPELRPQLFEEIAPLAVASTLAASERGTTARPNESPRLPAAYTLSWRDDPFSCDLSERFTDILGAKPTGTDDSPADRLRVRLRSRAIPYSVGGFDRPNAYEAGAAAWVLDELRSLPPQRSLLILPTTTAQARRVLHTLAAEMPDLRDRLVAVTGDGLSVNVVYRDGEFAWPILDVPVPMVLFAHQNPVGWDESRDARAEPAGRALAPPAATDDVFLFAEMGRILAEACFGLQTTDSDCPPTASMPARRADDLAARLRERCPAFFDGSGNRLGGVGEYVVVVRPRFRDGGSPDPLARLEVWRRSEARRWEHVRSLDIDQWRIRVADQTAEGGGG